MLKPHRLLRNFRKRFAPLTLLAASAVAAAQGAGGATSAESAPDELQAVLALPGDRARGEAAFVECVSCHRKDAGGRPIAVVPRLAGQHAQVIIKQVVDIRSGRRPNPLMKPIVDDPAFTLQMLADIAAYLQALPPPAGIVQGPGKALDRGKAIYEQGCFGCHGAAGEGQAVAFRPMVAAQHHAYLLRELKRIQNGERGNSDPTMTQLLQTLSPDDLQAVADHMSRLPAARR
jgi:cytochrome c553